MDRADILDPGWFAAVMGTGGAAIVAARTPGGYDALETPNRMAGLVFLALSVTAFLILVARGSGRRRPRMADIASGATGPTYATFPGAVLVIAAAVMALLPGVPDSAAGWWFLVLWAGAGTVAALVVTLVLFVSAFERDDFEAEDISGLWFVPETAVLLAAIVLTDLAISGAPADLSPAMAAIAIALTGVGAVLFALTAAVFFNRLIVHGHVHRRGPPAVWIMLSPLSVTALAVRDSTADFALFLPHDPAGMAVVADLVAALLWGFSLWWIAAAGILTWNSRSTALTRTPTDWAFVFPAAALAIATVDLGRAWGIDLISALGVLFSLVLAVVWTVVAVTTAHRLLSRRATMRRTRP